MEATLLRGSEWYPGSGDRDRIIEIARGLSGRPVPKGMILEEGLPEIMAVLSLPEELRQRVVTLIEWVDTPRPGWAPKEPGETGDYVNDGILEVDKMLRADPDANLGQLVGEWSDKYMVRDKQRRASEKDRER